MQYPYYHHIQYYIELPNNTNSARDNMALVELSNVYKNYGNGEDVTKVLIDLDLKRDAIVEAFELGSNKNGLQPKAVRTQFENLWVWPGHNFTQLKQMNVKEIVQKALDRFDFVLTNAPSLVSNPDRRQIISAAQAAFISTKSGSDTTKLAQLIKPADCVLLGNIQITP